MATPNYGYEKRQRELAKKQKKEEKLKAKTQRRPDEPQHDQPVGGPAALASPAPAEPPEPAGH
ncbi:hypothetical protein [Acidovorax soli]|uniref:hypothetical protein n=1 Tax=Acidovorax TaxID=12916 RepID=UPI0026F05EEB|nr:hypothetical protein [Acidovorax soli]MCM2347655.1 hypothetical protein [Acidovorax soli]